MARYRVRGHVRGRLRPRTVVTLVIVVVLAVALVANRSFLAQIARAMSQGALLPLVAAAVLEGGRIVLHALAYTRSFAVIGARIPLRLTIPAWFKAIFMNTVLPSGGTSGLAAVIDTARRQGVAVGSATSATLFTQTCYYSAMAIVCAAGLVVMGASGTLTARDVVLSLLIALMAAVLLALLAFGHLNPGALQRFMRWVERLVVRVCRALHLRKTPKPWADNLVRSFSSAATELSRRPRKALAVLGVMVLAMSCDMGAFVAAGFAFGITLLPALLAGYVTALVFNSFAVTPGGVGVVEGLAAAVLSGYGFPGALALSAVLTYRALMYWIPFAVGGVMMRVTGAFSSGTTAAAGRHAGSSAAMSPRERLYDVLASRSSRRAIAAAVAVTAVAVFEMVESALPRDEALLQTLATYVPAAAGAVNPSLAIASAYLLVLCAPGLLIRDQGCWLLTVAATALLGGVSALAGNGLAAEVALLVALALLVVWHESFTEHTFLERPGRLVWALVYGALVAVAYAAVGMNLLSGDIAGEPGIADATRMGVQALVGTIDAGALGPRALWFSGSCRAVFWTLVAATAFVAILVAAQRISAYRSPERVEMRRFNRSEARRTAALRRADRTRERRERHGGGSKRNG